MIKSCPDLSLNVGPLPKWILYLLLVQRKYLTSILYVPSNTKHYLSQKLFSFLDWPKFRSNFDNHPSSIITISMNLMLWKRNSMENTYLETYVPINRRVLEKSQLVLPLEVHPYPWTQSGETLQHTMSPDSWLYFDSYLSEYNKILVSFLAAFLLCTLLFFVSYLLSFSRQKESEKTSEYECGFEPFDNATRQPFDVHFYIVGILFLIFDVEIALLFPWSAGFDNVGILGFWNMILFLLILTIGFVYEWKRGALSWSDYEADTIQPIWSSPTN